MNRMHRHSRLESGKRQGGAVLVIALVLLLALTVLGVSTMSTARMEMRMAANDQFFENAFQLAETGLDTDIADLNAGVIVPPAATVANNCSPAQAPVAVADLGGTYQTTICFIGDVPDITGSSGSSMGKIRAYHFQNDSQGLSQSSASSLHRMGMRILGPDGS